MLNTESPLPLYHQLAQKLQTMIESNELKTGDKIPSENELVKEYKIGRPTVRQALDLLCRKGLLVRRKGAGTFVNDRPKEVGLFSLAGTSAAFQKEGIKVEQKIIRKLELIKIEEETHPYKGRMMYHLSRLSMVEKEPVLLEEIYLDMEIFKGLEKYDLQGQSISNIIEDHFYLKPAGGRQSFGVVSLDGGKADLLGLKKSEPVLLVKRELYFKQKHDAFYSELYCRTDRFVFYQELGGEI